MVGVPAQFAQLSVLHTGFSVLHTDGMRSGWRTSYGVAITGRALLLGLPLTLLVTALLAHSIAGLPGLQCSLLGAVAAPTDRVLAAAIVRRKKAPGRLRPLAHSSTDVLVARQFHSSLPPPRRR